MRLFLKCYFAVSEFLVSSDLRNFPCVELTEASGLLFEEYVRAACL